ncbi:hypothetical protein Droror1_Dr00027810 [Drosera rotundifolia]
MEKPKQGRIQQANVKVDWGKDKKARRVDSNRKGRSMEGPLHTSQILGSRRCLDDITNTLKKRQRLESRDGEAKIDAHKITAAPTWILCGTFGVWGTSRQFEPSSFCLS